MIVLGADMHKSSHTVAAVAAATGEVLDDKTAAVAALEFPRLSGHLTNRARWARKDGVQRAQDPTRVPAGVPP